jgi:NitT/TauT family transport system ATP-binding protein
VLQRPGGEFVCIIGPSGCGKTTLMNIIAGFVQPTAGRVTARRPPIAGPGPDRGVIFQEYGVFPWLTVEQNIMFGLRLEASKVPAARARRSAALPGLMGLGDFAGRSRSAVGRHAPAPGDRARLRRAARSSC